MKTTKFNIALLLMAMTFSAYVSGQQNLSKKENIQNNQFHQDEITTGMISNSSLNAFKVKIFQSPSNSGNVIMAWKGGVKIDQIKILSKYNEKELNFYVKSQNSLEVNNLENGTYFVWFYVNQTVVGIEEIKVKLLKKDELDFNEEQKDDALNGLDVSHNALNALKVKIYPNPSLTGKVKMMWSDAQQIDQIIILSQVQDQTLSFYVKNQNELTVDGLENGKYFVQFYSQQKLKGIKQIKVIKL
jgi:hypothetical protein